MIARAVVILTLFGITLTFMLSSKPEINRLFWMVVVLNLGIFMLLWQIGFWNA